MNPDQVPRFFPSVLPPSNKSKKRPTLERTPGWEAIPVDAEFKQSVDQIEDFVLGNLGKLLQPRGYFKIRRYYRENDEWTLVNIPIDACTLALVQISDILERAHQAGQTQITMRKRQGYYHRKSRGLPQVYDTVIEQAAGSAMLSTVQLGITAANKGTCRFVGELSLRFTDGNILKGSPWVSHEVPDLLDVSEAKFDNETHLIICLESEWAIHRLVQEDFVQRLSEAGIQTLLISTGGIPTDNCKTFLKFVAGGLVPPGEVVFIGDHDVAAVQIASILKFGSVTHSRKIRTRNLRMAPMTHQQIESKTHLFLDFKLLDTQKALNLLKRIEHKDSIMKRALEYMNSNKKTLQLAELADLSVSFSDEIWTMIDTARSQPLEPADDDADDADALEGLEPLFDAQEIQAHRSLQQIVRKEGNNNGISFTAIHLANDVRVVVVRGRNHFVLKSPKQRHPMEIPLSSVHERFPQSDFVKRLQTVYDSMIRVLASSQRDVVKEGLKNIEQVMKSMVEAFDGLGLQHPNVEPRYRVGEALIIQDILHNMANIV